MSATNAAISKMLRERFGDATAEYFNALVLPELPKIVTNHVQPPIPSRDHDWSATTADYEPGQPEGWGATEQDAVMALLEQLDVQS
jgi:hypothetical protein